MRISAVSIVNYPKKQVNSQRTFDASTQKVYQTPSFKGAASVATKTLIGGVFGWLALGPLGAVVFGALAGALDDDSRGEGSKELSDYERERMSHYD